MNIKTFREIDLLDKLMVKRWDEFVDSHPEGTPYHNSAWIKTLHETYTFKPLLYISQNEESEIEGVLPFLYIKSFLFGTRIVSLPFSDYGGPLSRKLKVTDQAIIDSLMKPLKKIKYIEIRNHFQDECQFCCHNYYKRHVLDLQKNIEEIEKQIDKRTIRYSIRKSIRSGVEVSEVNTKAGIEEFYKLNLLTRKKHGVPAQPKDFFSKLYKNVIQQNRGFILLAYYENIPIAASIFLTISDKIHYKYNASDPDYLKSKSPNHLITWAAIKKGVEEGYKSIDFGRTSQDNKGLIRYKEMWGTKGSDLKYYYYPEICGAVSTRESGTAYKMMTTLWKNLPLSIQNLLSKYIYKTLA
jgi:hypothetical protein